MGFRLLLLKILLMIALVSGAVLYGRASAKPNKLQQLGFDVCDGRPCFMGVTLGMPWNEVRANIAKREDGIYLADNLIVLKVQKLAIGIRSDDSQTYVDGIDFMVPVNYDPEISINTIIALFGSPCSVLITTIEDQIERISINYPEIHFTANGVSPDSTMESLMLSKNSEVTNCATQKGKAFWLTPWKGFRGLSYYMADRSP